MSAEAGDRDHAGADLHLFDADADLFDADVAAVTAAGPRAAADASGRFELSLFPDAHDCN